MKRSAWNWQPIWLILVIALILRMPLLAGSFWLDEAAQALESARPLTQQFQIIPDFQPPLLHLLIHLALYLGESEWWLRTVGALIPGLISIWLTYKIGQRIGSEVVARWAAVLLATSSFHIFYSQELRPYALPTMWGMLSWWLLLRDAEQKMSPKAWLGFTLTTIAGIYSSYLYPFLLLGQLVWVGWDRRDQVRSMVLACVGVSLAFIPWLPIFLQQLAAGGQVREALPGWEAVVSIPQLKSLPLVLGKFIYGVVDLRLTPFFVLSGTALALLAGSLIWKVLHQRRTVDTQKMSLYLIWLIVPLLSAWIISFWIPVVQPKRVLYLLPPMYLAIMWVATLSQRTKLVWLLGSLLLLINISGTLQYYLQPIYQRENWRQLHQDILEEYPVDSVLLFSFPEPFAPWRWYDDGQYPTLVTEQLHISQVADLTALLRPIHQYRFVIVPDYLRDLSDPDRKLEAEIEAYGYELVELKDYPNIGFVRIFGRPGATLSKGDL